MVQIPSRAMLNRVHRRLVGALKPTTAFANTNVLYEIIPTLGATRIIVRIKTAGAGGTLDLVPAGPDVDPAKTPAFASIAGTLYTTNLPAQVTIVAGTENMIKYTCEGENYVIVRFTGTGTGTITYCDVSQVVA